MIATKSVKGVIGIVDGSKGERVASSAADARDQRDVMVDFLKGSEVADDAYPDVIMEHLKARGLLVNDGDIEIDDTTIDGVMAPGEKPGQASVEGAKGPTSAIDNDFG